MTVYEVILTRMYILIEIITEMSNVMYSQKV